MHAASASSLEAGPAGQGSPQLQESTRDLVAHGSLALVVVHGSGSGAVAAVVARRLGGGSGGGSSVGRAARLSVVCCSAAEKAGLEAWARG